MIVERITADTPRWFKEEHIARYTFAAMYAQGKRVLDIACGSGYGSKILAGADAVVEGVDISQEAIAQASRDFDHSNVIFHTGDIVNYDSDHPFDIITCFETIEHVDDYQGAIQNLYRLLKPGGILIISTPNRPMSWRPVKTIYDKPTNPFHVREFDLEEFTEILTENGFEVDRSDIFGQRPHLNIGNQYLRKLYHAVFRPYYSTNPVVKPLRLLPPLYIIITAHKPC